VPHSSQPHRDEWDPPKPEARTQSPPKAKMLIDSHAHLDFYDDPTEILANARAANL
jgi:hypothetical protein